MHHSLDSLFSAEGLEPLSKFSERGLYRTSIFRGGCWERGGNFFQRSYNFYIENKLKFKLSNDKKSL